MKITVTKEDILEGIPRKSSSCPIAIAMWRKFKVDYISVRYSRAYVAPSGASVPLCYKLPLSAREFIRNFDAGNNVYPFEFEARMVKP